MDITSGYPSVAPQEKCHAPVGGCLSQPRWEGLEQGVDEERRTRPGQRLVATLPAHQEEAVRGGDVEISTRTPTLQESANLDVLMKNFCFAKPGSLGLKGGADRPAAVDGAARERPRGRIRRQCYCCRTERGFLHDMLQEGRNPVFNDDFRDAARSLKQARTRDPNEEPVGPRNHLICFPCSQVVRMMIDNNPEAARFNVVCQQSSTRCMICGEDDDLRRIPLSARIDVFLIRDIFIPKDSRACRRHFNEDETKLDNVFIHLLTFVNRTVAFSGRDASLWMEALRREVRREIPSRFRSLDNFAEDEFYRLTSLTKPQFLDLLNVCQRRPVVVSGTQRNIYTEDLILFLCKLRQGLSDDFLGVMFQYPTRQDVNMTITKVRLALMQNFVPQHLGCGAITREDFIQRHVTDFANEMYKPEPQNRKAILVIDGTYLQVPKSSNHRVLRQSFCRHKNGHVVKPILIVAPNGYILDVHGPYYSDPRNNDGLILRHQLENDISGLRTWLQEGDVTLVDRGYRDGVNTLHQLGIQVEMPGFVLDEFRQGSWEDANQSRLVTKSRWIVEARNGHIKSIYKFFRYLIHPHHIPHLSDFLRIACALINAFRPEVLMNNVSAEYARQMKDQANRPNTLRDRVRENNWTRQRADWVPMNGAEMALPEFPRLNPEYIRHLTFGTYQLKLSRAYTLDKIRRDNGYDFRLWNLEPGYLRADVYSRHSNATQYHVFISFIPAVDPAGHVGAAENPIDEWYCTCKTGARTLGTCAHIASVLWYLGYARHGHVVYPPENALRAVADAANREVPDVLPQFEDLPGEEVEEQ